MRNSRSVAAGQPNTDRESESHLARSAAKAAIAKRAKIADQDLFNPKTGAFTANIRNIGGDDSELRESLQKFGWVKELPALVDENGVVLVGHRRMKIAEEEKIEPVIKKLILGKGDAADAERVKLAIASNIGSKPMTKEDRKHIAEHLYGGREWTMERIAEALNVSKATISGDLRDCSTGEQSKRPKTASNPKGSGRPKGSRSRKKTSTRAPNTKEPSSPQPQVFEPQHTPVESAKLGSTESLSSSAPADKTDAKADTTLAEFERRAPDQSPESPAASTDTPVESPAPSIAPAVEPMESAPVDGESSAPTAEPAAINEQRDMPPLADALGVLISILNQDGLGEKDGLALIAAKPDFDYVDLLDLIKGLNEVATAWKSRESRAPQRRLRIAR
jgi:hypothetical protein